MLELLLAYLAGLLTIINPCVLPLLPVILASSAQTHQWGPVAMATGLGASFVVLGFSVNAFGHLVGLTSEDITFASAIIMVGFGAILLVPKANEKFAHLTAGFAQAGNAGVDSQVDNGLRGQFASGALLGAIWSPCIGPTLGGAIGLAATGQSLGWAFLIMVIFALGAMTVVLGLSFGSRELVMRRRDGLMKFAKHSKLIMGIALVVVGTGILFGIDKMIEGALLSILPEWLIQLSVSA